MVTEETESCISDAVGVEVTGEINTVVEMFLLVSTEFLEKGFQISLT